MENWLHRLLTDFQGSWQIFVNLVIVESLQSHCIHTMSHWSSGLPVCFPSWGTRVQSPGGYLCKTGILLLALSRYIGDPNMIDHCGLVWGGLCPELSLDPSRQCDNPTWSHTALLSRNHARCRSSWLHNHIVGCWGEPCEKPAILLHSHHVSLVQWSTHLPLVMRDPGSIPKEELMWNRDSPVSVVSLH